MNINFDPSRRGQALIMTTLSLFVISGMMGLAVDLGWDYFVSKAARTAADSAALGAVNAALARVGQGGVPACGSNVDCYATPTPCSSLAGGQNLINGCQYATQNGFADGGAGGRQQVRLSAGVGPAGCMTGAIPNCVPTAPGVPALYWVTARASQRVPQLFSAMLGNTNATVLAESTAVISYGITEGTLILTNRINDYTPFGTGASGGAGINLSVSGSASVDVGGGIIMASAARGDSDNRNYAGLTSGGGGRISVKSTYAFQVDPGAVNDPTQWDSRPVDKNDDDRFLDPMRGKGQPPLTNTQLPDCWIDGSLIDGTGAPVVLGPGNYYATHLDTKTGVRTATGEAIQIKGDVKFSAASSATKSVYGGGSLGNCYAGTAGSAGGSAFGNFVFYGGLTNAGGNASVLLDPGRYVIAGALQKGNGDAGTLLSLDSNMGMTDTAAPGPSTAAGEMFVLTDPNYSWGTSGDSTKTLYYTQMRNIPLLSSLYQGGTLKQGSTNIQAGNSSSTSFDVHGLNPDNPVVKGLDPDGNGAWSWGPLAFWQDQRNSTVRYTRSGDIACGDNYVSGCGKTLPSDGVDANKRSPEFVFQGSSTGSLYGVIYQPRGAWMRLQGGNSATSLGWVRMITGALQFGGSSKLSIGTPTQPILQRIVALVE
jgi:Putative Flp pilus-assembly TadE/G-like